MFTLGVHRCIVQRTMRTDSKQPGKSIFFLPHRCRLMRDDERALTRIRVSHLNASLLNLI